MKRIFTVLLSISLVLSFTILIPTKALSAGAPVVTPGVNPTFFGVGGARYRAFKTLADAEVFEGVPDLGLGGAYRTEANIRWGNHNDLTFTYDKANDRLRTTVTNSHDSWTLDYPNFSSNVTTLKFGGDAGQAAAFLSALNTMTISILLTDSSPGVGIEFSSVMLDGSPLGTFTGVAGGTQNWSVTNYDFSNGFTLSGQLSLTGAFGNSAELSKVDFYFGQSDSQGPLTSNVVAAPNPVATNANVTVTANADDSTTRGSNIQSAEYSLAGGPWATMTAQDGAFDEVSEDVTATFIAPGSVGGYNLCVRAKDAANNTGTESCLTLRVDDQGPVTSGVTLVPDRVGAGSNSNLTATVDDSAAGGSNIASAQYSLNSGPWTALSASDGAFDEVNEAVTATLTAPGSAGSYNVCVRGTDTAGNTGAPACTTLVVDDQGPDTSAIAVAPNPIQPSGSVTLTASVDDTAHGGSNIASAEYSLDGGPWTAMNAQDGSFDEVSEAVTASFTAPGTPGMYTTCVRGTDATGNTGAAACTALLVDGQGPTASNPAATPNPLKSGTSLTFTANLDDSASGGSNLTGAEYSLDGGPWTTMNAADGAFDETSEGVTATFNAPGSDGSYTLCVRGTDAAGNSGSQACTSLQVDSQGPETSGVTVSPNPVWPGGALTLTGTVSDGSSGGSNVGSAQYSLDGGPWVVMDAEDGAFDETSEEVTASFTGPLASGSHTICTRGLDAAGNLGAEVCINLVVDDQGPVSSGVAASPNPIGGGAPVTLSAVVDDSASGGAAIASAEFSLDGGPWTAMSASDGAFDETSESVSAAFSTPATAGDYNLCVRGVDATGNTGAESCTSLHVDTQGPAASSASAIPNPSQPSLAVVLSATVDDSGSGGSNIASAEYSLDGGPWTAMTAQDGAFDEANEAVSADFSAPGTSGSYQVCLRGTDAASNTGPETCLTLVVDDQGPAASNPTLTPNPAAVGVVLTLTASIDDTASAIASAEYSLDGGPWTAMSASDGAFDEANEAVTAGFSAPGTSGAYQVCVRGTDAAGNTGAETCTTLNVDDQGPVASAALAAPNPSASGDSITLTGTVDDTSTGGANLAAAEYSLDGGQWTAMEAQDGAFDEPIEAVTASFKAPGAHGQYSLCLRGRDAAGNTGPETCTTLGVDDQDPIASAVTVDPDPAAPGAALELTAHLTDVTRGGLDIASAEYNVDGGLWRQMQAGDGDFDEPSEDVTANLFTPDTSGAHTLCVRGDDAVGNTSEAACTSLDVDGEGPTATEVSALPNPAMPAAALTLTATIDDTNTGGSQIASAEYSLDGGPWVAMSAQDGAFDAVSEGVTASSSAPATPSDYNLCVRGVDTTGNTGGQACTTVHVDGQGPVTSSVSAAPNPAAGGAHVTLTAVVDDATTGGSQIAAAEYRLDSGSWTAMSAQDGVFDEVGEGVTATVTAPAGNGAHPLCVRARDAAGNTGAEACASLTVVTDTQGPATSNVAVTPNQALPGTTLNLNARVDDSATGGSQIRSATYSLDSGPWTALNAQDGALDEVSEDVTASLTAPASAGAHQLCVRGTDAAGKTGGKRCTALVIDNQGPLSTNLIADPNPAATGSAVRVTAAIDDSSLGGTPLQAAQFSFNDGTWRPMSAEDGAFDEVSEAVKASLTVPNEAGSYSLCVRGKDTLGNTGAKVCIELFVIVPEPGGYFVNLPFILNDNGMP